MTQFIVFILSALIVVFPFKNAEAQSDLERAQNLSRCLDGRYPILCKKGWLSAADLTKVEAAERRENLKICLTGRYPILCNRSKLSPEDASRVAAAERSENLKTCLTGRYSTLCRKGLLTERESQQVLLAEQDENLRVCLTGRYQSLCNVSMLTKEQLAQTRAAESRAGSTVKGSDKVIAKSGGNRVRRRSSSDCESGHWVESVSHDGEIVKLEDGSIWEVDSGDAIDSSLWLPTTDIVACDDKLINTDDDEAVSATRIR